MVNVPYWGLLWQATYLSSNCLHYKYNCTQSLNTMPQSNKIEQTHSPSSWAIAYQSRSSGVSLPAVTPNQKAPWDSQPDPGGPYQFYNAHPPMKAFPAPGGNENTFSGAGEIKPFQLKPNHAALAGSQLGIPQVSNQTIQRYPVPGGQDFKDNKYTDVLLKKLSGHVYQILNKGEFENRLVVYDVDMGKYYDKEEDGDEANYDQVFDIAQVSSKGTEEVPAPTFYDRIGEAGKGVGNVRADTTLETSGLLTCVGWLLYNDTAAYLTHIVVLHPEAVIANCSIRAQAGAVYDQFVTATGTAPTNLRIQVDEGQQAYAKAGLWQSGWMRELVPGGCQVDWIRGDADLSYVVKARPGVRKEWTGTPIKVSYGEK